MSLLDEALPSLEDLEPEELKYLRRICKALNDYGGYGKPREENDEEEDDSLFDADELGLDPETDDERY